jgi:hypothetical protein
LKKVWYVNSPMPMSSNLIALLKNVIRVAIGNGWAVFQTQDGLYACGDSSWGTCAIPVCASDLLTLVLIA